MRINECGHSCRTSAKVPSAKRKGATDRRSKKDDRLAFDKEQNMNYVLRMFIWECNMIRAVVEEAAAFVSITLFIGMIAVWADVMSSGL
jgi:hypothetical protein